jgi:alpha-mannosidase
MSRTAHYVPSSHWDREWYESLAGYRFRLVELLDDALALLERNPSWKSFTMDGQLIPIHDYLEVRPERAEQIKRYAREGKLKLGPWYVLPDEWLVCGESIVRNLQYGMQWSAELGAKPSVAGWACDQFGHVGQLPQILAQIGAQAAFVWRGLQEEDWHGLLNWKAPDGTTLPCYRFGKQGYCTMGFFVRELMDTDRPIEVPRMVDLMVEYVLFEAKRSPVGPIILFDGADHIDIEPQMPEVIAQANKRLAEHGIQIIHSDLDSYLAEVYSVRGKIDKTFTGEMRESGKQPLKEDEVWLIPGVLSSRIHLKQRNAACEDELTLWAEPFSAFATALGHEWPAGYLRTAWKWLLDNHPHDSICGCSIDQVHQDMIYRFDQSLGLSSRLTERALKAYTLAATPTDRNKDSLVIGVFNATAEDIEEPVDIDIPLPTNWPTKFQEFFGFEEKFSFKLKGPNNEEVPYQLVAQRRDTHSFRRRKGKFPVLDARHLVTVTARLKVPAYGYTTLLVEPFEGPTRYLGTMSPSHRSIENEHLRVTVNPNGTLQVFDKRSKQTFDQLLTFDNCADIGDGWFHGVAVNDQVYTSTAAAADVALVANGPSKATLRIVTTMNLPKEFDFRHFVRSPETKPLKIVSDVTLRQGSDRIEVKVTVENNVLDHRVRVLFPTNLKGDTYLSDSAYDVVERPVALLPDNAIRRELDLETRPQITWTAFGDGKVGLAVVSRGQPESAVQDTPDRAIALTLFRSFRRAIFQTLDDNPGGQIQGTLNFRFDIVPYAGPAPVKKLFLYGQRVLATTKQVSLAPHDFLWNPPGVGSQPRTQSLLKVSGDAVVTSIQKLDGKLELRCFNPAQKTAKLSITPSQRPSSARSITLDGKDDTVTTVRVSGDTVEATLPAKRIATIVIG